MYTPCFPVERNLSVSVVLLPTPKVGPTGRSSPRWTAGGGVVWSLLSTGVTDIVSV